MWNVLIAEDDEKTCRGLSQSLKDLARCTIVHSGEQALDVFEDAIRSGNVFDFLLLDVSMPEGNGFETLKAIRTVEEELSQSHTHIIMITAYKDSLMEKYNMCWDDFITKPIETAKLIAHMQALIANKKK